jgi:hypothetical protein
MLLLTLVLTLMLMELVFRFLCIPRVIVVPLSLRSRVITPLVAMARRIHGCQGVQGKTIPMRRTVTM